MSDNVNHPNHYTRGKIEVLEFIIDQDLPWCLGNAIKYICRCRYKGKTIEDLEKAQFYLQRHIDDLRRAEVGNSLSNN